jgi:hypothetical protein
MAYREELTLKARGLHKYSDSLESVPEGSLQEAVNVVLDKNDLISPRRGYETLPGTLTGSIGSLHTFTDSDRVNTLISHRDDTTLARYDDVGEVWTNYAGTYSVPDSSEVIRSVESNKNIFFATSKGVQKLDTKDGVIIDAGAPEALTTELDSLVNGGFGWLAASDFAAYRVVWGYRDANDNLIIGAPSSAVTVENVEADSRDVVIRTYIPTTSVDETWFVQLYRTKSTTLADAVGDTM